MSMTQTLAPHLPYLRRYARALTGSQQSGDAHVRAALQALLTGDESLTEGVPPRVGLYRLFHAIWQSGAEHYDEASEPASIGAKSPEAQKTIDSQLASRVMIIEGEPIIAMDLENLVTELGHKVVAVASTKDEAVAKAHSERPGLVLADINLGEGGSGIDAVSEILAAFDIPVIFITAYPEKLLTGERPEPTYLIAKPFLPETVQATVGQALFFHPVAKQAA